MFVTFIRGRSSSSLLDIKRTITVIMPSWQKQKVLIYRFSLSTDYSNDSPSSTEGWGNYAAIRRTLYLRHYPGYEVAPLIISYFLLLESFNTYALLSFFLDFYMQIIFHLKITLIISFPIIVYIYVSCKIHKKKYVYNVRRS